MGRVCLAFAGLVAGWLLVAAPAVAADPANLPEPLPAPAPLPEAAQAGPQATPPRRAPGDVRRHVSDARVFSATSTCFYGPTIERGQARHLCVNQTRGKLIDTAASNLAADPGVVRLRLSHRDLRAFADSLMRVSVADEEIRPVPDGTAVRLTLRAETPAEALESHLAAFAADGKLRAAALAETAKRDRLAAEARMAAVPFGADREFAAKGMENKMREDASFAARRVVPGMSMPQVKELMGNPAALKQAVIGPESYVCAGYGRIWVVFRDGLVSCLRTRLDYVDRYATDCHCAGNYSTILKND